MSDLTDDLKARIREVLVGAYEPYEIYLYGDFIWSKPGPGSLLNILVILGKSQEKVYKRPQKGNDALKCAQGLAESGMPFDLTVYTRREFEKLACHQFTVCSRIKEKGEKIYVRANGKAAGHS